MKVIAGQSLSDVAVQEDGSIETVFEWALKNGKSITEKLTPGETLINPNSSFINKDISTYFQGVQKKIATALTNQNHELIVADEGIGAMIIESTFIVR
ncbi:hypothetical protein [Flavobacterium sp. UMI-01]|uniref:hypothetical protein n=1 Tax=Flavobacterium sp. UMI-01 TaxID=1441053 RepID=UPI001C7DF144|nr:hypothetical protein [Flavobacterium sp. UMI-01]GIZ09975.1 hypothetical protein FUMI01_27010 [Flavobacterium sp. UMI-01]